MVPPTCQQRTLLSHDDATRKLDAAVGANSRDEMPSAGGDGRFPADPYYKWISSTDNTSYGYKPNDGALYYLIVPVGSDRERGPVGHYDR